MAAEVSGGCHVVTCVHVTWRCMCVYVCAHVCTCVCVWAYVCACVQVCAHVCGYVLLVG